MGALSVSQQVSGGYATVFKSNYYSIYLDMYLLNLIQNY